MEKRIQPRVKTHQLARIEGKMGLVNNMSGTGLHLSSLTLPSRSKVEVEFHFDGHHVIINGTIKWFRRKNSLQRMNQMGVMVTSASPYYYQMVNKLAGH